MVQLCKHDAEIAALEIDFVVVAVFLSCFKNTNRLVWLPKLYVIVKKG